MHRALQIQEILSNIFGHCYCDWSDETDTAGLASLARTCRTFKEQALDVLWEEMEDLSPLAKCLPEASHQLTTYEYSFRRPLTQTEWDILRSYTCRIRRILDFRQGLDEESRKMLSNSPTTEPLFPNLRHLRCQYKTETMDLLHLPFPSLISLDVELKNPQWFQDSLQSFREFSPNIKRLSLYFHQHDIAFSRSVSSCVCWWQNLQSVVCPQVALEMDALVHLSRMPALTLLDFAPSATLPASDSPLLFSNLRHMTLRSKFLGPISQLLSLTRQLVVINFTAFIAHCPTKQEMSSFYGSVQTSGMDRTIVGLWLTQSPPIPNNVFRSEELLLGFEDLRPCMTFSNLRRMDLDIEWKVSLTDTELLTLASAWPHITCLFINGHSGWNTLGGITPNGLLQILQKCPSLGWIALAMDTRGYTESPANGLLASLGSPLSCIWLNVVDSIIEAESVPAVSAFFACTPSSHVAFNSWDGWMVRLPGWEVYEDRWDDVRRRANARISQDFRITTFGSHFARTGGLRVVS